jgi:hypothetical protein
MDKDDTVIDQARALLAMRYNFSTEADGVIGELEIMLSRVCDIAEKRKQDLIQAENQRRIANGGMV